VRPNVQFAFDDRGVLMDNPVGAHYRATGMSLKPHFKTHKTHTYPGLQRGGRRIGAAGMTGLVRQESEGR